MVNNPPFDSIQKIIIQKDYRVFMMKITPNNSVEHKKITGVNHRIEKYFERRPDLLANVVRKVELRGGGGRGRGPMTHWLTVTFKNIDDANMFKLYFVGEISTGGLNFE